MVDKHNGATISDGNECKMQEFCPAVGVAAVQPLEVSAFLCAIGAGAEYECGTDDQDGRA
jgi:hypothetical protein